MTRRSLKLSPKDWQRLQDIATATNSCATKGTTMGQPTWRALIRRIAQGELMINERSVFPIEMICPWCEKSFVRVMASCGTGTTWSLYKCPHCEKFTAEGWAIPDTVREGLDTKIVKTEPFFGASASKKIPSGDKNIAIGESVMPQVKQARFRGDATVAVGKSAGPAKPNRTVLFSGRKNIGI